MNRRSALIVVGLLAYLGSACAGRTEKKQPLQVEQEGDKSTRPIAYHSVDAADSAGVCTCPIQFDLKDSAKLRLVKGRFYKSATGHLYETDWAQHQPEGEDTLSSVLYFNGYISQDIDPLTFEPLDGWYAKDKKHVYYYRPVSGGTQISKIDTADTRTFQLLPGHYRYARDKNFFYDEAEIIDGFTPGATHLRTDDKGDVVEMTCRNKIYRFAFPGGTPVRN